MQQPTGHIATSAASPDRAVPQVRELAPSHHPGSDDDAALERPCGCGSGCSQCKRPVYDTRFSVSRNPAGVTGSPTAAEPWKGFGQPCKQSLALSPSPAETERELHRMPQSPRIECPQPLVQWETRLKTLNPARGGEATQILLITDIGRDIDDTLALLTLAAYVDEGKAAIAAVITGGARNPTSRWCRGRSASMRGRTGLVIP